MDNQIKLRGLRIELGEIEEVINSFDGILTSITIPVDNQYLCCYFIADHDVDTEKLMEYASKSLAHYMVPEVFIQLEKMPMTQNGKVDKKALPKPVSAPTNLKAAETPIAALRSPPELLRRSSTTPLSGFSLLSFARASATSVAVRSWNCEMRM